MFAQLPAKPFHTASNMLSIIALMHGRHHRRLSSLYDRNGMTLGEQPNGAADVIQAAARSSKKLITNLVHTANDVARTRRRFSQWSSSISIDPLPRIGRRRSWTSRSEPLPIFRERQVLAAPVLFTNCRRLGCKVKIHCWPERARFDCWTICFSCFSRSSLEFVRPTYLHLPARR